MSDNGIEVEWEKDPASDEWHYCITGLPRYDENGTEIDYQISQSIPGHYKQVDPADNEKANGIFDEEVYGYVDANFVNELKTVQITGKKTWEDYDNLYQTRPTDLELTILENHTEMLKQPEVGKQIQWDKSENSNEWTFTVSGLPEYREDGQTSATYTSEEVSVARYTQKSSGTGNEFINELETGSLQISKTRINGYDEAFIFYLKLYVGTEEIDYTGDYKLIDKGAGESNKTTEDGKIIIKGGESAVIDNLPADVSYEVIEAETEYFELTDSTGMKGKTEKDVIAPVAVTNTAKVEMGIVNDTEHPEGASTDVQITGGKVAVTKDTNCVPENPEADRQEGGLVAVWQADELWLLGDSFVLSWVEFPDCVIREHQLVISDYLNEDGTLKPISDSVYDELRARFPEACITMSNGIVYLRLSNSMENMPFETSINVKFLPTLAIYNITPNEEGGAVAFDEEVECNGNRRHTTLAMAKAEAGYRIKEGSITVNVPSSITPTQEKCLLMVEPDENGRFSGVLKYQTNTGTDEVVIKGQLDITYDENRNPIKVVAALDKLEVSLDVEVEFVKITQATEEMEEKHSSNTKTGDNTNVWMYLQAFLLSLLALYLVIKYLLNRRVNN